MTQGGLAAPPSKDMAQKSTVMNQETLGGGQKRMALPLGERMHKGEKNTAVCGKIFLFFRDYDEEEENILIFKCLNFLSKKSIINM